MIAARRQWLARALVVAVVCAGCGDGGGSVPDASAVARNNRAVGLMGRFDYDAARDIFAELAEAHPDWLDVQVNLAIATLNRQREGDEDTARVLLGGVLDRDPRHLRAQFCMGLVLLYVGETDGALDHFRMVARADPRDAYAAYYVAQILSGQSRPATSATDEEALEWYRKAIAADPYLRSAYYGAFGALQRLDRPAEAHAYFADYERLEHNPHGRLVEFKYTRMGPRGEALAVDAPEQERRARPPGPIFGEARPLPIDASVTLPWSAAPEGRVVSPTAVDIQGDSRLDLFIPGALSGAQPNALLLQQPDGGFAMASGHPLAGVSDVNAALWGDVDNDGRTDVYLCRRGPNQLWRQVGEDEWRDVTRATGIAGGTFDTVDGALFDADHDGDLDVFLVNADGPNELLSNNLDGTFRSLADRGIAGDGRASRAVVVTDLDADRDVDIVVLNDEPPHEVYLNDRLWAYRAAPGFEQLTVASITAAVAGDVDADGRMELYTVDSSSKVGRWQPDAKGEWQQSMLAPGGTSVSGDEPMQIALVDVSGDGTPELVRSTPPTWTALRFAREGLEPLYEARVDPDAGLVAWAPVLIEPGVGPAVIGFDRRGAVSLWPPGPGRDAFAALTMTGMDDPGHAMRSNASGIGTKVAARVASRWTLTDTFRNHSGPGQSLQPLAIGLGGGDRIDFVEIDWSDGVFQSEVDLAAGAVHRIAEEQRQLSSCPVLFAWNGKKFEFVSDILGVGGIGYATGPGEYAPPRPWENFLLPRRMLREKSGRYHLKVAQVMEEVAYLDAARLVAYDLPPGWHMVLDERMGTGDPAPTGAPRFYRREVLPERATNDRDEDVRATIAATDSRAAPPGRLDRRFIGRLEREHVLTLTFAEPLDAGPGEPVLVADGWIEYPYSQTMFAAWQAGAVYAAPSIEARGRDGRWMPVLEQFGYPAGMPRQMSVPLGGLPPGTNALRLRTNEEIYWDRLAVAYTEPLPDVRRRALALRSARLAQTGFPHRSTGAQRRPYYDYDRRRPFWDTRYLRGAYTALGPADALVRTVDDALVIFGPGEETHLEFDALDDAPPPGWSRHFVFETNGWAKDMDLYTRDGDTVAPLPTRGTSPGPGTPPGPRDRLHARYNTRYASGR